MATAICLSHRLGAAAVAAAAGGAILYQRTLATSGRGRGTQLAAIRQKISDPNAVVSSRTIQESALIRAKSTNPLDVLVIGGGATGCGVALDAATRGLRVGLVEREDFSSGTSSRSTKLIHGGVRYLEKDVFNLDYWQLSWYSMSLRNDLIAGPRLLHLCRYYSAQESSELFPTLARKGKDRNLKGMVVYYDGQMNDSRLNVGLACTATLAGAVVLNHAEVRIIGARIRDNLSGKEFNSYAKVIVDATGPLCDSARKMANKDARSMISPSSGVHIVLPDYYSPEGMGLIVPKAKDGRVVFMLPWLGRTIAGTTDSNTHITLLPEPHEDEIQFILDAISDYLNVKWYMPIGNDPSAKNTESISRDRVVCEDHPGLVTITGGNMAEDAVNAAIKSGKLSPTNGWDPASFTVLAQQYVRMKKTQGGKVVPSVMDTAAAKHLSHAYGTLAEHVAAIAQNENLGKRLAHGYPFLEAEVAYCARNEYLGRALPRIIEILATEHKWDKSRMKQEFQKATKFLGTFKSAKNAQFHDGKHIW
ncbi:hypothetical protein I3843_14G115300 [Carya illinoinensis]|nr:hypothetical protein I3843_14G115300 [Carya illinoinensis]